MRAPAGFTRDVLLLTCCQALLFSALSLIVATSALVGFALADDKSYATLPFAGQLLATMLTSLPAGALMARIGRRAAFQIATLLGMAGGGACTLGIVTGSFALFVAGSIGFGIFAGFGNFYRFAAADSVPAAHRSRTIGYLMAGGVVAAFVGPQLANLSREAIGGAAFAGSYASLVVLCILSLGLLSALRLPAQRAVHGEEESAGTGRALATIVAQPVFIVAVASGALGYAVMTLLMSATPLAMQHHGHAFSDSSFVIQWHVLGMFAPSFITGHLINRFGVLRIMGSGALAALACVATNLAGQSVGNFWLALTLLGLAWNFLFIGATTLLTEAYRPAERFKTQALNDFLVFSTVAAASLSSGALHHHFGWETVNYAAVPMLAVVLLSLAWLGARHRALGAGTGGVLATDPVEGAGERL